MFLEHEGSGHHDGTELGERRRDEPELVVTSDDDHDHVALADAERFEEVCRLIRPGLHVREGEDMLLAFRIAPDHCTAGGVVHGYVVDDVIAEVEGIGIVKRKRLKRLVLSVGLLYVAQVYVSHGSFS